LEEGPGHGPLRAAGGQSFIQEEDGGATLPPAGASRAEALFTVVGTFLLLLIAITALWIMINRRR
jgi:hypothetical protein